MTMKGRLVSRILKRLHKTAHHHLLELTMTPKVISKGVKAP
jgi:hypothetical protein